ncbi:MAG: hypothetical protein L0Z62_36335 [Gemmataceae bacterium]|nr:hypothetical protein [Gemmataceae bacterium]
MNLWNRMARALSPRLVQLCGWSLIIGGVLIPLGKFLRSPSTWESFYGNFKYYFHDDVLGVSLPFVALGTLVVLAGSALLLARRRLAELEGRHES